MTEAEARADALFPALVQKYRDHVNELWRGDSPWSAAHFESLAVRELQTGKIPMHGFRKDSSGDVWELVPGERPKKIERTEAVKPSRKKSPYREPAGAACLAAPAGVVERDIKPGKQGGLFAPLLALAFALLLLPLNPVDRCPDLRSVVQERSDNLGRIAAHAVRDQEAHLFEIRVREADASWGRPPALRVQRRAARAAIGGIDRGTVVVLDERLDLLAEVLVRAALARAHRSGHELNGHSRKGSLDHGPELLAVAHDLLVGLAAIAPRSVVGRGEAERAGAHWIGPRVPEVPARVARLDRVADVAQNPVLPVDLDRVARRELPAMRLDLGVLTLDARARLPVLVEAQHDLSGHGSRSLLAGFAGLDREELAAAVGRALEGEDRDVVRRAEDARLGPDRPRRIALREVAPESPHDRRSLLRRLRHHSPHWRNSSLHNAPSQYEPTESIKAIRRRSLSA